MNILFGSTDQVKEVYADVDADMEIELIAPSLIEGTELYILPYIGRAFYEELANELSTEDYELSSLSNSEQDVLFQLKRAQWYFGYYLAIDSSIITFGSRGPKEIVEEGSAQPRQWVFNTSKEAAITKADLFLDKALAVLESAPDDYPTWKNSEAFTLHHQHLLTIVQDFPELGGSRRTFSKLHPYIDIAEERYLASVTGPALLEDLKQKQRNRTSLSTEEVSLMKFLKTALRNYALHLGAHDLRLMLNDKGIMIASTDDGIGKKAIADRKDYHDWLGKKLEFGEQYINQAKDYLDQHASAFAAYYQSPNHNNTTVATGIEDIIRPDQKSVMT